MKKIITRHVLTILLLLSAFAALLISCFRQPVYPAPPLSGSNVVIDVSTLKPEVPQFFTYRHRDKNVNFFIVKIQDKVLAFLDACVTCYPKKRGYQEKEGYVVCRACDMSFSVYKLEKGLGGCYPIQVNGNVEKGNYLIPLSGLEGHADKF